MDFLIGGQGSRVTRGKVLTSNEEFNSGWNEVIKFYVCDRAFYEVNGTWG